MNDAMKRFVVKWRCTAPLILVFTALVTNIGCSPDGRDNVPKGTTAAKAQGSLPLPHIEKLPDGTLVPTNIQELVELRNSGDIEGYLSAARDFLRKNRNDFVAADVMTIYAKMRMTNEFRDVGLSYATNSTALLLEFAEIANNETWQPMLIEFAQTVAQNDTASYAELFRSTKFLTSQGCVDGVGQLLQRLKQLAVKRYQKEDVGLMICELAVRQGVASQETEQALGQLANEAMMPQVRKSAARLLETIHAKD